MLRMGLIVSLVLMSSAFDNITLALVSPFSVCEDCKGFVRRDIRLGQVVSKSEYTSPMVEMVDVDGGKHCTSLNLQRVGE